ncbi:hypothetical protein RvY_08138-2 [Ramazzottius varieornatus]|uniref:Uncharacterized protein n=1 Tax=Ramazzottius varieornatus TaxID=947166 RepID=A0A1D1VAH7_RAMVA|nr:hypothetical protein RvY_08138-2 [Ramazzottius varieornatus]
MPPLPDAKLRIFRTSYNPVTYGRFDGTDYGGGIDGNKRGFPPFSMSNFRLRIKPSTSLVSQKTDGQRRLNKRFSYDPVSLPTWPIKVMGEDGTIYAIFLPDKHIPSLRSHLASKPVYGTSTQSTTGERRSKPDEKTAAVVEDAAAVTNFPDLKFVHLRFG